MKEDAETEPACALFSKAAQEEQHLGAQELAWHGILPTEAGRAEKSLL